MHHMSLDMTYNIHVTLEKSLSRLLLKVSIGVSSTSNPMPSAEELKLR